MGYSFVLNAPTMGVEDNNTCIAAAEWMLRNGVELFSRKMQEDGSWWVILHRPALSSDDRWKGEGDCLGAALVDAFEKMGLGGICWKLWALEKRIILLTVVCGWPQQGKRKKTACPHGVTGGRCRQCV